MADGDTTMMNGKKYVLLAGRWQPADSGSAGGSAVSTDETGAIRNASRVEATRRPAVEANAQQGLNQTFKGAPGKPESLQDQQFKAVAKVADMVRPNPKTDKPGYMKWLAAKIDDLRKKAKDVKSSKSGGDRFEKIYNDAADSMNTLLLQMQSEDVGASEQQLGQQNRMYP
jgi:hypothetical protein